MDLCKEDAGAIRNRGEKSGRFHLSILFAVNQERSHVCVLIRALRMDNSGNFGSNHDWYGEQKFLGEEFTS